MTYDPQRKAPRGHPGEAGTDDESPVDALLDGPNPRPSRVAQVTPSSGATPSEPPPFSVVPEPTPPNADLWKLGVLGAVAALISLIGAWRLRRWWMDRDE